MSVSTDTKLDNEQDKNRTEDTSTLLNPPEPVPKVVDLFKQMNLTEDITDDPGPHANIDCQPDARIILYQLIDHSIKIFEQHKGRNIPSITPASLLAVFMHQINTFGALADIYSIRETMSKHASEFSNITMKLQSLNIASWLATPPFIRYILEGLYPTCDPERINLSFIFSYASFSFNHDLGRFFPLHMFLALHNIIAAKGANASTTAIWYEWLQYPVYRPAQGEPITVANIIGGAYDVNIVDNYLTKKLRRLLSVTVSDQRQRKAVFQEFKFPLYPAQADLQTTDAYSLLLSADVQLIPSIDIFLNTMSPQFAQIFTNCEPLGSLFKSVSGSNIMNHYYDELQPPTFHRLKIELSDPKKIKIKTNDTFLRTINYRCTYLCEATPTTEVILNDPLVDLTDSISLIYKASKQPENPDLKESPFQQTTHKSPIFLYSPWSTGASSMYYPITTGMHIETSEIDSFHVPYPRTDTPLHDENSIFLSSAIPFNATVDVTDLDGTNNLFTRYRAYDSDFEHRTSHSLYDMTQHWLPMYANSVHRPANTTMTFPGYTTVTGVTHPNLMSLKVAYDSSSAWSITHTKEVFPNTLFVWSSYRWQDPTLALSSPSDTGSYFIADFRPLYGTAPQTFKSFHLYDLIK